LRGEFGKLAVKIDAIVIIKEENSKLKAMQDFQIVTMIQKLKKNPLILRLKMDAFRPRVRT
jgi:hypothetical protein